MWSIIHAFFGKALQWGGTLLGWSSSAVTVLDKAKTLAWIASASFLFALVAIYGDKFGAKVLALATNALPAGSIPSQIIGAADWIAPFHEAISFLTWYLTMKGIATLVRIFKSMVPTLGT